MAILVGTHSPKLQTCEHDLTITLRCPEIEQTDVGMSQLFAIAGLVSNSKDPSMIVRSCLDAQETN